MKNKTLTFFTHLPVMLIIVLFYCLIFYQYDPAINGNLSTYLLEWTFVPVWFLINFYAFYFYFMPTYFEKRKITRFLISSSVYVFVIMPAIFSVFNYFTDHFKLIPINEGDRPELIHYLGLYWMLPTILTLFSGLHGVAYRFIVTWFHQRSISLLIHLPIFLTVMAYLFSVTTFRFVGDLEQYVIFIFPKLLNAAWFMAGFYLFYSYLVPKYLAKGKYYTFGAYTLLLSMAIIPAIIVPLNLRFNMFNAELLSFGFSAPLVSSWFIVALGTLLIAIPGVFYRFSIDWFENQNVRNDLENKHLQSELKMLKSRLNPHLLFNTLNNIDSLIHTAPERASESLSRLSDLLRYVVYETDREKVALSVEIDNLKKYVELEKIRLLYPDSVTFNLEISDNNTFIAPMILFPFVENGFKHSNLNNKDHRFSIFISGNNEKLIFEATNDILDTGAEGPTAGVGLELAKKRLELIYANKHELKTGREENKYLVKLHIDLT